jgi:hypothetical protein
MATIGGSQRQRPRQQCLFRFLVWTRLPRFIKNPGQAFTACPGGLSIPLQLSVKPLSVLQRQINFALIENKSHICRPTDLLAHNANGFRFVSDPAATSISFFAQVAHEHNGSRIFCDLRAPEKLRIGSQQLIYGRFSLSRIEPVPFRIALQRDFIRLDTAYSGPSASNAFFFARRLLRFCRAASTVSRCAGGRSL